MTYAPVKWEFEATKQISWDDHLHFKSRGMTCLFSLKKSIKQARITTEYYLYRLKINVIDLNIFHKAMQMYKKKKVIDKKNGEQEKKYSLLPAFSCRLIH